MSHSWDNFVYVVRRASAMATASSGSSSTAGAEVEQTKLDVIGQYRDNVHDLTRAVGEDVGDACFPTLRKRARKSKAKTDADVVLVDGPTA